MFQVAEVAGSTFQTLLAMAVRNAGIQDTDVVSMCVYIYMHICTVYIYIYYLFIYLFICLCMYLISYHFLSVYLVKIIKYICLQL
jgi:hypothetical protein